MADDKVFSRRNDWLTENQVELDISHGEPSSVSIEVWAFDLLETEDFCVEPQGTSYIADSQRDVVCLTNQITCRKEIIFSIVLL